jgi:hypothetical protein
MQEISVLIAGLNLRFDTAQRISLSIAQEDNSEPMTLSWYDKKKERFSPNIEECTPEGLPAWEAYAKNRGGRLKINLNQGEYIFIYT